MNESPVVLPEPSRHTAIYARVSTGGPSGQDISTQIHRLRETAQRLGFSTADEFKDEGVSGRLESRPGFDALRAKMRNREIETVLTTKLDRLGRSARAVLEFFDEAERLGVRVILTDQSIDTWTPVGRLLRTQLAGIAEFEADLIRERTRDAMAGFKDGTRKTRTGRPVGRPTVLTPAKCELIARLGLAGLTWPQIAIQTGIKRQMARRTYYDLKSGRLRVENSPSGEKILVRVPRPPKIVPVASEPEPSPSPQPSEQP